MDDKTEIGRMGMAKQVTVYEDCKGKFHRARADAAREDAFYGVEKAIGLGTLNERQLESIVENADKVVSALQPFIQHIVREAE